MDWRFIVECTGECFWPSPPPTGHQRGGHPGAVPVPVELSYTVQNHR